MYQQSTPPISPEFGPTKGLAAPQEHMYIHFESSAQADADFPLPFSAINHTDVVQRKGWKVKVFPSQQTLPPLPALLSKHHPY